MTRTPPAYVRSLVLTAAVLSLGCSDDEPADESDATGDTDSGTDTDVGGSLAWQSCQAWECATLQVPVDYDAPDGDRIDLALLRIAGDQPIEGVIMFNPGGPGIATLPQAGPMTAFFDIVAPHHDVVLFDNRGVGLSTPVDCVDLDDVQGIEFLTDITTEAQLVEQQTIVASVIDKCRAQIGDTMLREMGTFNVVRDMEQIRQALGVESFSFVGGSYGTVQAALYAQSFPDRVDAFMLDAVVAPSPNRIEALHERARSYEQEFDRFLVWCGDEASCAFHGGEGKAAVGGAFDALAQQLVDAQVVVDGEALPLSILLGVPDVGLFLGDWPGMASQLARAEAGDWMPLVEQAAASDPRDDADAMRLRFVWEAIRSLDYGCPAGFGPTELFAEMAEARAEFPRMGVEQFGLEALWCMAWPEEFTAPHYELDPTSSPPLLLLSGRHDPATPLSSARNVQSALGNGSFLLEWEGEGHTVAPNSPCAVQSMTAFVADPSVPPNLLCEDGAPMQRGTSWR